MSVDITQVITDAIYWVCYPFRNWGFQLFGLSFSFEQYFLGCACFGLVCFFIKWLATGDGSRLKFLGNIFGGG